MDACAGQGFHQVMQLCCLGMLEVILELRCAVRAVLMLDAPVQRAAGLWEPLNAVPAAWHACVLCEGRRLVREALWRSRMGLCPVPGTVLGLEGSRPIAWRR